MSQIRVLKVLPLVCAIALLAPLTARAEECGDQIARLQARLDTSRAHDSLVPDLPESNFATMHRQPTQASVAGARKEAEDKAGSTLGEARKLQAKGDEKECLRLLQTFSLP